MSVDSVSSSKTNIFQSKLYTLIYCRHFRTYSRCAMFDWSDTVFRRRNVTSRRISNTVLQPRYWGSEADSPEVCRLHIHIQIMTNHYLDKRHELFLDDIFNQRNLLFTKSGIIRRQPTVDHTHDECMESNRSEISCGLPTMGILYIGRQSNASSAFKKFWFEKVLQRCVNFCKTMLSLSDILVDSPRDFMGFF
jgi:hypothetical protein